MNFKKLLIIMIMVAVVDFSFSVDFANAQNPLSQPFGGPLLLSMPCPCSANFLLVIQDYRTLMPIFIIFQPGYSRLTTIQNTMSLSTPGSYTLGTYAPGGVCLTGVLCIPAPVPINGTITPLPFPGIGFGSPGGALRGGF
ncbi:MAG TPA: hypothetical protein PKA60_01105 [Candidatus Paceibacterota bacterium]|nr:hypothetical protein [Candidatus Paceibacterota bacterium]